MEVFTAVRPPVKAAMLDGLPLCNTFFLGYDQQAPKTTFFNT